MPNLAVQVADLNTDYLYQSKKYEKQRENPLTFFHPKGRKKDRHKLNFKTRHWVRFLRQENYLLTSLEEIIKGSLSGGCRFSYIALKIDNKNLFFLKNRPTEPYYLEKQKDYLFAHLIWREKEQLDNLLAKQPYQFKKKWQEIKTKVEILSQWDNPAKLVPGYKENGRPKPTWEATGWNSPDYWEPKNRSLAALAFTHDTVLGKVEVPLLDLDPNKKDKDGNYKIKQAWLRKALVVGGKKWKALINKYQIPYYWTTGTPGNCLIPIPYWLIGLMKGGGIYHQDTGEKIGDLLSQGDLVALPVGGDKNRQLVITEWGKKLVKKHGVAGVLNKSLLTGNIEEKVEEVLNGVYLSLNKFNFPTKPKPRITNQYLKNQAVMREYSLIIEKPYKKQKEPEKKPLKRQNIQAKILSKHKTNLEHLWKVFYLDWKTKTTGYFLVNNYQKSYALPSLDIGSVKNMVLVQGIKHDFLSRIATNHTINTTHKIV